MEDEDGEQARLPKYLSQPPDHHLWNLDSLFHLHQTVKAFIN